VLGIEAARVAILTEITESFDTTYINHHHLSVLCDRMTANETMVSIFRHGINNDHIGPIAKASFEETPEMFLKAARHAELDNMRGVSANVMCGQEGYYGTSSFQVLLNLRAMANAEVFSSTPERTLNETKMDDDADLNEDVILVADKYATHPACSAVKLEMPGSNAVGIKAKDLGAVSSSYDLGF
jgi:DNA-directed RNA polymerase II subunit RPB1